MPLSRVQRDALAALALRCTPTSFVAGAAPLTQMAQRLSVGTIPIVSAFASPMPGRAAEAGRSARTRLTR